MSEVKRVMTKPEELTIPLISDAKVGEIWSVSKECMDRLDMIYDEFFASSSLCRDAYLYMMVYGQLPDDYIEDGEGEDFCKTLH